MKKMVNVNVHWHSETKREEKNIIPTTLHSTQWRLSALFIASLLTFIHLLLLSQRQCYIMCHPQTVGSAGCACRGFLGHRKTTGVCATQTELHQTMWRTERRIIILPRPFHLQSSTVKFHSENSSIYFNLKFWHKSTFYPPNADCLLFCHNLYLIWGHQSTIFRVGLLTAKLWLNPWYHSLFVQDITCKRVCLSIGAVRFKDVPTSWWISASWLP